MAWWYLLLFAILTTIVVYFAALEHHFGSQRGKEVSRRDLRLYTRVPYTAVNVDFLYFNSFAILKCPLTPPLLPEFFI